MEMRVLVAISEVHSGDQSEGLRIVRAAIRAMREPTSDMIANASVVVDAPSYMVTRGYIDDEDILNAWHGCIDAASPEIK
jgi:hypothetical protein